MIEQLDKLMAHMSGVTELVTGTLGKSHSQRQRWTTTERLDSAGVLNNNPSYRAATFLHDRRVIISAQMLGAPRYKRGF